jgi:hypothetical protein
MGIAAAESDCVTGYSVNSSTLASSVGREAERLGGLEVDDQLERVVASGPADRVVLLFCALA